MDTVNLYTRQHENSFYELENTGQIINRELYVRLHMKDISTYFLSKYNKFISMAEKIVPRPEGSDYPIWCSVSKKNCLKPVEKEIVYCLQVPKEEVIYFDGLKWDYVLNNLYIGKDKEDEENFNNELKKYGIRDTFSFFDGKLAGMYPLLERKIENSWDRIFEIDNWNEYYIQANLWRIKKEWVKHIVRPGEDLFEISKDMEDIF